MPRVVFDFAMGDEDARAGRVLADNLPTTGLVCAEWPANPADIKAWRRDFSQLRDGDLFHSNRKASCRCGRCLTRTCGPSSRSAGSGAAVPRIESILPPHRSHRRHDSQTARDDLLPMVRLKARARRNDHAPADALPPRFSLQTPQGKPPGSALARPRRGAWSGRSGPAFAIR
jgi:hypothetical protein